jgi:hypothetical protein
MASDAVEQLLRRPGSAVLFFQCRHHQCIPNPSRAKILGCLETLGIAGAEQVINQAVAAVAVVATIARAMLAVAAVERTPDQIQRDIASPGGARLGE